MDEVATPQPKRAHAERAELAQPTFLPATMDEGATVLPAATVLYV
jgi:hypothetical protein